MLWNNQWRHQREKSKKPGEKRKGLPNVSKSMGHGKIISKRKVLRDTGLPQQTRKISNKQFILIPKGTRKGKKIRKK